MIVNGEYIYGDQALTHSLVGKKIESVWASADREALMFVTVNDERIYWKTYGDCCSRTWIESVDNLGFKGKVLNITNDGALQNPPPDDNYEVIAYYGHTIFTEYGRLVIDFRNSSNGYYGGNLEVVAPITGANWKEIT